MSELTRDVLGPVLQVINDLKAKGLLVDYAIGGGVGVMYYAEPVLTYDFDIVCVFPDSTGRVIDPSPVYRELRRMGFIFGQEDMVVIKGVPVQFIPAAEGLMTEAIRQARMETIGGVAAKVLRLEHLMANMLTLWRAKDRAKLAILLQYEPPLYDQALLKDLIQRYGLAEKWAKINEP